MPPSGSSQKSTVPAVIVIATAVLVMAIMVIVYEVNVFISLTHDLVGGLLIGEAKIISIVVVISIMWIKRPGVYILSLFIVLEAISLGVTLFGYRISIEDTLTIGALFLAVLYYRGFFGEKTSG